MTRTIKTNVSTPTVATSKNVKYFSRKALPTDPSHVKKGGAGKGNWGRQVDDIDEGMIDSSIGVYKENAKVAIG
ncbi:1197_t:CDS:2 [Paraglomus occultum]|uniref:1197_t:CDS:1 n=1 Tax=Paraglomus occultum TaxID=144539 RepID=A0A9N8Z417_9GLOM|nr:1197_t:CDS:2 [Paraglomus occultum]